jgi:hypothetical protein
MTDLWPNTMINMGSPPSAWPDTYEGWSVSYETVNNRLKSLEAALARQEKINEALLEFVNNRFIVNDDCANLLAALAVPK